MRAGQRVARLNVAILDIGGMANSDGEMMTNLQVGTFLVLVLLSLCTAGLAMFASMWARGIWEKARWMSAWCLGMILMLAYMLAVKP